MPDAGQPGDPGQPDGPFGAGVHRPSGSTGAGPGAARGPSDNVGATVKCPGRQEHRCGGGGVLAEGASKLACCFLLVVLPKIVFGSHCC